MNALLLTVLCPVAGSLIAALGVSVRSERLERSAGWLVAATSAVSFATLLLVGTGRRVEARWFSVGAIDFTVGLETTPLTWSVSLVVAGVAMCVLTYATRYMRGRDGYCGYFAWMGLFVGAMLGLVLSTSLASLVFCWEAVGVASFALIGFEYEVDESRRSARKAFLVTRSADAGLLLAWMLAAVHLHTTDIAALVDAAYGGVLSTTLCATLAVLFLVAVLGKSAQLPFSLWLPDAMVASTPVSALLHSATMVMAGVYLVLRLAPLFEAVAAARWLLVALGGVTALLAALLATVQDDIKRVFAWSTVSQMGEMLLGAGVGATVATTEHLGAHAMFKAALFLGAGLLEHEFGTRELAGLRGRARSVRGTAAVLLAAAFSLASVPPLAGFWGEDEILARATEVNPALGALVVLLVGLAGMYVARAVFTTLRLGERAQPARPPITMIAPAAVLAFAATIGGLARPPLERLLGSEPVPSEAPWRFALTLAGLGGLAWGALRALRSGPVPAIGGWPRVLEPLTSALVLGPARGALLLASATEPLERGFDAAARGIASAARRSAMRVDAGEATLAIGALALARATSRAATHTSELEDEGLARAVDGMAHGVERAGDLLRRAQTGKLYLYTLSLFVSVVLATAFLLATGR